MDSSIHNLFRTSQQQKTWEEDIQISSADFIGTGLLEAARRVWSAGVSFGWLIGSDRCKVTMLHKEGSRRELRLWLYRSIARSQQQKVLGPMNLSKTLIKSPCYVADPHLKGIFLPP